MTVLELNFPAGRFHATPWGRHVNEGAIEWPPSPWRIVRALVATWHWKAKSEVSEDVMRSLVGGLAVPPRFRLPRATTAHTRHYMPYNEGKNVKTTKVFDTFVQVAAEAPLWVAWEVDLSDDARAVLEVLADRLCYFGRAEGLVIGRVHSALPEGTEQTHFAASPLGDFETVPPGHEIVRLLCPMGSTEYDDWRREFSERSLSAVGSKPIPAQKKTLPRVPESLFEALHADTGDLQAAGWNLPPGAKYVTYTRPERVFATGSKPRPRRTGSRPTVARFALTSVVPPAMTRALAVGEQVHALLCKKSDGHPVFTGVGGRNHRHAHVLCESIDDLNAHITHVTVYCPEGFDPDAAQALRRIQWTCGFRGHELRLVLLAIGQPHEFDSPLFATSRVWRSLTPFVSTCHAKAYRDGRPKIAENGWQVGSAPHDLLRLLHFTPKWQGARIQRQIVEGDRPFVFGNRQFRSIQFQTVRHDGEGRRGHGSGAAFVIEFPEPVSGPIAVGYGAHFGLGLFVPA